ncbi:MAG: hypothetical protein ACI4Q3_01770 [Kiritimatiellia bacterium]
MIQKFLTKYGLSAHLALLAALPLALTPFLTAAWLGAVILWLSAFAAVWIFLEPSILAGERLSSARARVRGRIAGDPVFYFFLLVVVGATIRCLNTGIEVVYDPEQTTWLVKEPSMTALPASTRESGFLPWAVAVGLMVVTMGIRHSIGLGARLFLGLMGSLVVGLGGIAASVCACNGEAFFVDMAVGGLDKGPFWSMIFGTWLLLGIASGVVAEARNWKAARLPFFVAVMGNVSGLLFFSPPVVAVGWTVAAVLTTIWCLLYLNRAGSVGAVARSLVLLLLGAALSVFLLVSFSPESVVAAKARGVDVDLLMTEAMRQNGEALSRIGRQMWMAHPWGGVGLGAYGLNVPFLAEKADWAVMAAKPLFAQNSYWTLLAERGIVGCLLLLVGLGLMLWYYVSRLVQSYQFLRTVDDADVFAYAVPPIVWTLPVILVLMAVESAWLPELSIPAIGFAVVVPLALCTASFPRGRSRQAESESERRMAAA